MNVKEPSRKLIAELQVLSKILRSLWIMDRSTHELLCSRHKLLERYILSLVSDDIKMSRTTLMKLLGSSSLRKDFLHNIQESFIDGNQLYIYWLKQKGLTKREINHCCLLTLGLNSKEAGIMSENRSHYNHSSTIRSKLELVSNDTNLGLYLKSVYEKLQCETFSKDVPEFFNMYPDNQ